MNRFSRIALILGLAGAIATPFAAWGAEPSSKAPTPSASKGDGKEHVATCVDGKEYWSASTEHRGACSGHGGVLSWSDGTPVKAKRRSTDYR